MAKASGGKTGAKVAGSEPSPESEAGDPTPDPRVCVECRQQIAPTAVMCPHCQSYQSRFRRGVVLIGQTLAVLSVVGSAVAYMFTAWPEVRKAIAWRDDLKLMRVSLYEGIDGINVGDGPVFVQQVEFEGVTTPDGPRPRRILEWVRQGAEPNAPFSRPFNREGGGVIDDVEQTEWLELVKVARGPNDRKGCVVVQIVANSEPDLAMYRLALGAKLRTFDVKATVHYFSIEKQRNLTKEFVATGFLLRRKDCAPGQVLRLSGQTAPAA